MNGPTMDTLNECGDFVIVWHTRDESARDRIRNYFGFPRFLTMNHHTPVDVKPEQMVMFEECARRGFYGILKKKWRKNGDHYVFISRK